MRKNIKEAPVNLSVIISEKLARLTETAYKMSRSLLEEKPKLEEKKSEKRFPLNLNVPQVQKYQFYEFHFDPQAAFAENKILFDNAFGEEESEALVKELSCLLPDGVKLIYLEPGASNQPKYEYLCYITILNIYLAGKYYIKDQKEDHPLNHRISANLDKARDWALKEIQKLYALKVKIADTKVVQHIVLNFQNKVRAHLACLIGKPGYLQGKDFEVAADELFKYENRIKTGNKDPELAALEKQLNLDLFLLDSQGTFQFNRLHLPLTTEQRHRLNVKLESEEIKEGKQELKDEDILPQLYRTIRSHENSSSLPNFYEFYEGAFDSKSGALTVKVYGLSHGSPLNWQTSGSDKIHKHKSARQVFSNFNQNLQIIRAKKIESLLLEYNSYFKPKISLSDIQNFSLAFSDEMTHTLKQHLLTGDIPKDCWALVNKAFTKNPIVLPPSAKNIIMGKIEEIIYVQNFYCHIINGHDDSSGKQKIVNRVPSFFKSDYDDNAIEASQFRACRLVQYAMDPKPEKTALVYLCLPIDEEKNIEAEAILGTIRAAMIEALLSTYSIFPDALYKYFTESSEEFKLNQFKKDYYNERFKVSQAAKEYLLACDHAPVKILDDLRKKYKDAEEIFFNNLKKGFAELTLLMGDFSPNPKTHLAETILKTIFQIFDNNKGEWISKHNGTFAALFYFLINELNQAKKTAIMASGGCNNNNDRWQILALILREDVLHSLEAITADLNKNYPYDLLHYRAILDMSGGPRLKLKYLPTICGMHPRASSYYYPSINYTGSFNDKDIKPEFTSKGEPADVINTILKCPREIYPDFASGIFGATGSFAGPAVGYALTVSPLPKGLGYKFQDNFCIGALNPNSLPIEHKSITELFIQESKEIHTHLDSKCLPLLEKNGSTLISIIIDTERKRVTVSSLGDSLCFVIRKNKDGFTIHLVNHPHKPDDEKEQKRLGEAKALTKNGRLYKDEKSTNISVTGAYGDKYFDPFMLRIPEIQNLELEDSTYFIVASDGLALKKDEILNLVRENINQKASNQVIARALTEASVKVSKDDTTIIFIQADLLPPGSVTRYDVADGHGLDSEFISGAITNFIRSKHEKPQDQEIYFESPIDRELLPQLSLTARRQNSKQNEFGWLSEEEFISLSAHPLFSSWISLQPSIRLQESFNELIFNFVYSDNEIRDQIRNIDSILDLSSGESLCRDWLVFRLNMLYRRNQLRMTNDLNLTQIFLKANKTLTRTLTKHQLDEKQIEMMIPISASIPASDIFQSLYKQALKVFLSRFAIFIQNNQLEHLKLLRNEGLRSSDDINIFIELMDKYYRLKIESAASLLSLSASSPVKILDEVLGNFKFVISWSSFASSLETALDRLQTEAKPKAAVLDAPSSEGRPESCSLKIPYPLPVEEDDEEGSEAKLEAAKDSSSKGPTLFKAWVPLPAKKEIAVEFPCLQIEL